MTRFGRRKRRGSVMLEFALVMPFFLIFIMIMADVGLAMLVKNAAQDAAFAGARAGAQIGATQGGGATAEGVAAAGNAVADSFAARMHWLGGSSMTVVDACSDLNDPTFRVDVSFTVPLSLLKLVGLGEDMGATVTGVSRCEIVRG